MKNVCVVGLTGQSGCGKSTVAARYRERGYTVLDADAVAAGVLASPERLAALAGAFGADILDEQGRLRRRLLADRAFSQPGGQQKLTQLTHPYIIRALLDKIDEAGRQGAALVFVDGAVIVGEPFERCCDKIVVVDAPVSEQVRRLCARDGITEQQARTRLSAQLPKDRLLAAADAVITNDGDLAALLRRADLVLDGLEHRE